MGELAKAVTVDQVEVRAWRVSQASESEADGGESWGRHPSHLGRKFIGKERKRATQNIKNINLREVHSIEQDPLRLKNIPGQ